VDGNTKAFDFATSEKTFEGIYSLEGDSLRLCYNFGPDGKRPTSFITKSGSEDILMVLKRQKDIDVGGWRLPDGSKAWPPVFPKRPAAGPPPQTPKIAGDNKPFRVGVIIVVGNDKTPYEVIRKELPLTPGELFDPKSLEVAMKNLAATNRFVVDPQKGVGPRVELTQSEGGGQFVDIVVIVQEK
jgi:hypothetical protein